MINPRLLMAGLLGLAGGVKSEEVPGAPTVNEIWGHPPTKKRVRYQPILTTSEARQKAKRKIRWAIAKQSRKVNYRRHGTRG